MDEHTLNLKQDRCPFLNTEEVMGLLREELADEADDTLWREDMRCLREFIGADRQK